MPMCDIYIQEGALEPAAEATLVAEVSRLLSDHEVRSIKELGLGSGEEAGARIDRAESIAWMFVHRTATYVAGKPVGSEAPRGPVYKFAITVPQGLIDEPFIQGINKDILAALTKAEGGRWRHPELRYWAIIQEIQDGFWGAAGNPFPLSGVVEYVAPGWGQEAAKRLERKLAGAGS